MLSFSLWKSGSAEHQFSSHDIKPLLKCQVESLKCFRLNLDGSLYFTLGPVYLGSMAELKNHLFLEVSHHEFPGELSVLLAIRLQDATILAGNIEVNDGLVSQILELAAVRNKRFPHLKLVRVGFFLQIDSESAELLTSAFEEVNVRLIMKVDSEFKHGLDPFLFQDWLRSEYPKN